MHRVCYWPIRGSCVITAWMWSHRSHLHIFPAIVLTLTPRLNGAVDPLQARFPVRIEIAFSSVSPGVSLHKPHTDRIIVVRQRISSSRVRRATSLQVNLIVTLNPGARAIWFSYAVGYTRKPRPFVDPGLDIVRIATHDSGTSKNQYITKQAKQLHIARS